MKSATKSKVHPVSMPYASSKHGALGLVNADRTATAYTCREVFHRHCSMVALANYKQKIIVCTSIQNLRTLFLEIEDRLQIPVKERASFFLTTQKDWIYANPKWWRKDMIRFQLFSILLKESYRYTTIAQMTQSSYIKDTKEPFDAFMNGNTIVVGMPYGWVLGLRTKATPSHYTSVLTNTEELKQVNKVKALPIVKKILSYRSCRTEVAEFLIARELKNFNLN